MSQPDSFNIARCPEHGLHGRRDSCFECGGPVEQVTVVAEREIREAISWMGPHGQRSILERLGLDCAGCGAPAGYPPAGPCDNHGMANAVASTGNEPRS